MPLDDLVSVIETLQARIRDHGATLRENETRTRMALINPLLTTLGWDVSDPELVTPEYNVSGRWADYALLGPDGKPAATVEAKKLGESLGSHRMQMLNYSNASGVEYAGLTDGDHWELYEVFQRGQLEDRRVLEVSVASMRAHEIALKMLLLWQLNLGTGQRMAMGTSILPQETASEPILTELIVPALEQPTEPPPPTVNPPLNTSEWIVLDYANPKSGEFTPIAIRFPDGQQSVMGSYANMLTQIAEWLVSKGLLTNDNVPVLPRNVRSRTNGTCIVNTEPKHLNGTDFRRQHRIGNTVLVLNVSRKPRLSVNYAKALLAHCGIDPATVHLQMGQ